MGQETAPARMAVSTSVRRAEKTCGELMMCSQMARTEVDVVSEPASLRGKE